MSKIGSRINLPNPYMEALGIKLVFIREREGRVPRKTKKLLKKMAQSLPAEEIFASKEVFEILLDAGAFNNIIEGLEKKEDEL